MKLTDILIEIRKEKQVYFKSYFKYVREIKKIARKYLRDANVYLFGSTVKKSLRPDSDIDVFIISSRVNMRIKNKIRTECLKKLGYLHPFELHIITPHEFNVWYKNFVKDDLIKV